MCDQCKAASGCRGDLRVFRLRRSSSDEIAFGIVRASEPHGDRQHGELGGHRLERRADHRIGPTRTQMTDQPTHPGVLDPAQVRGSRIIGERLPLQSREREPRAGDRSPRRRGREHRSAESQRGGAFRPEEREPRPRLPPVRSRHETSRAARQIGRAERALSRERSPAILEWSVSSVHACTGGPRKELPLPTAGVRWRRPKILEPGRPYKSRND
jgi:hypothetical protein